MMAFSAVPRGLGSVGAGQLLTRDEAGLDPSTHHIALSSYLPPSLFPLPSGFVWCQLLGSFYSFPYLNFLLPAFLPVQHYCTSVHWCWSPPVYFSLQASQSHPHAASTCLSPFLLFPRFPSLSPRLRSPPRSLSLPSPSAPSSAMTMTASVPRCFLPLPPARSPRGSCLLCGQRMPRLLARVWRGRGSKPCSRLLAKGMLLWVASVRTISARRLR